MESMDKENQEKLQHPRQLLDEGFEATSPQVGTPASGGQATERSSSRRNLMEKLDHDHLLLAKRKGTSSSVAEDATTVCTTKSSPATICSSSRRSKSPRDYVVDDEEGMGGDNTRTTRYIKSGRRSDRRSQNMVRSLSVKNLVEHLEDVNHKRVDDDVTNTVGSSCSQEGEDDGASNETGGTRSTTTSCTSSQSRSRSSSRGRLKKLLEFAKRKAGRSKSCSRSEA
jgi:hypothetical protein